MPVNFDTDVRQFMKVWRTISDQDEARNIVIPLEELVEDHRGSFISIEKINVTVKDGLCLEWAARFKDKMLVPGMKGSNWTSVTNVGEGFDVSALSETLRENVQDYSFSVLKTLYEEAKPDMDSKQKRKGASYEFRTFYLDGFRQEGGVDCMLLSQNLDSLLDESSDHPLVHFVNYLLENESTSRLLEYFSDPHYDALFKYGVELSNNATKSFPMTTSIRLKSANSPCETVSVLPMEALRKMGRYLQELENKNHLLYIDEKQKECPMVVLKVPAKTETQVIVDIEFLMGLGYTASRLQLPEAQLQSVFTDLNPVVMANYYNLATQETEEQLEVVLEKLALTS